jgi:hypothetical protein
MENFYGFFNNNELDKRVVGLYLQNPKKTISEIAKESNKSIGEIYRILKVNEIEPNRLKINHKKVESLARLGWGIKEIAEFTGYTTRNVRYILKGSKWQ